MTPARVHSGRQAITGKRTHLILTVLVTRERPMRTQKLPEPMLWGNTTIQTQSFRAVDAEQKSKRYIIPFLTLLAIIFFCGPSPII